MTQSGSGEHYKKVQQEKTFAVDSAGNGGARHHRQEYQRAYGPDRDQLLDKAKSGHEL